MGAGLGDSTPASHSPGKRQHKTETRILLGGGKEKIIADGDLAFIANPKRGVGGRKCAPGCCPGAARGRIPGSWAPGDRRQPCSSRTSPGSPGARGSLIVADTQPFPQHVRGVGGTWDAGWPREPLWLQPTCPHVSICSPRRMGVGSCQAQGGGRQTGLFLRTGKSGWEAALPVRPPAGP